jgi:ribosome-associated toxin RatA of RatAB toxin-antitoxin module
MPEHSEHRKLPYTARQIYDLVADVGALSRIPALDGGGAHPVA